MSDNETILDAPPAGWIDVQAMAQQVGLSDVTVRRKARDGEYRAVKVAAVHGAKFQWFFPPPNEIEAPPPVAPDPTPEVEPDEPEPLPTRYLEPAYNFKIGVTAAGALNALVTSIMQQRGLSWGDLALAAGVADDPRDRVAQWTAQHGPAALGPLLLTAVPGAHNAPNGLQSSFDALREHAAYLQRELDITREQLAAAQDERALGEIAPLREHAAYLRGELDITREQLAAAGGAHPLEELSTLRKKLAQMEGEVAHYRGLAELYDQEVTELRAVVASSAEPAPDPDPGVMLLVGEDERDAEPPKVGPVEVMHPVYQSLFVTLSPYRHPSDQAYRVPPPFKYKLLRDQLRRSGDSQHRPAINWLANNPQEYERGLRDGFVSIGAPSAHVFDPWAAWDVERLPEYKR